jgi:hypothetical protein
MAWRRLMQLVIAIAIEYLNDFEKNPFIAR